MAEAGQDPINLDISSLASSPINLLALQRELDMYDSPDRDCILDGFTNGFSLHYTGPRVSVDCKNLKSAFELPALIQDKINSEILAGRVAGPFYTPPIPALRVSPIGLVPKKVSWEI